MRYIYLFFILGFFVQVFATESLDSNTTINQVPKSMSAAEKKARFYRILVPSVEKIHEEWMSTYNRVRRNMINKKHRDEINLLKRRYKAATDLELLYALYPHPQSIVLAQAAMESAWATSRFYREANNIFGMWSSNENQPRIAAGIQRNGTRTIWLRKFDSVDDSIRAYYRLMARGKAFKEFRKTRYQTDDVHEIVKKLDKYSEIGDKYGKELSQVIRFNGLIKYDI